MDAKLVAKYLTALKEKSGLTYEIIAEKKQKVGIDRQKLMLRQNRRPKA